MDNKHIGQLKKEHTEIWYDCWFVPFHLFAEPYLDDTYNNKTKATVCFWNFVTEVRML